MAGTTRDKLNHFLKEQNLDAPNVNEINAIYEQLQEYLHENALRSQQDSPNMPMVFCEKAGTFRMDIPARDVPLQVAVFGTISPTTYHDLIWEQVQTIPEYKKSGAGIYEVQKLPVLRFLIHFKGLDFDWTYHQTSQLLRSYKQDFLKAPQSFLATTCGESVSDLIQELVEKSEDRARLASTGRAYYATRAWASLNGTLDDKMGLGIVRHLALPDDEANVNHPVLHELLAKEQEGRLADIEDEAWLQLLTVSATKPVSEKVTSSHYLLIKVMHTGCSNTQATTWFRYIEERLPLLDETLKTKLRAPGANQSFNRPLIKPCLGRLTHASTDPSNRSYYEGCYLFSFQAPASILNDTTHDLHTSIEKWAAIITRHASTIPGKCFINTDILTSTSLSALESQNGPLVRCLRTQSRIFLPAPIPISTLDNNDEDTSSPLSLQIAPQQQQQQTNKLRTASDIQNRLLHDSTFNIDQYIIGYIDRFSPVPLEMRAADWERVKEHEAFIPESRIRYFKRRWMDDKREEREEMVWDRTNRIDKIFSSGNSTGEGLV